MKTALYVRVSTYYQIDKDSLPLQRNDLINYTKYILGCDDYVIFEDAGYSGKDTIRPGFQDMMKKVKTGEFTHILVWKIDRSKFGRFASLTKAPDTTRILPKDIKKTNIRHSAGRNTCGVSFTNGKMPNKEFRTASVFQINAPLF